MSISCPAPFDARYLLYAEACGFLSVKGKPFSSFRQAYVGLT